MFCPITLAERVEAAEVRLMTTLGDASVAFGHAGAFVEPREARALLAELQAAAIPAALVVRTGRPI